MHLHLHQFSCPQWTATPSTRASAAAYEPYEDSVPPIESGSFVSAGLSQIAPVRILVFALVDDQFAAITAAREGKWSDICGSTIGCALKRGYSKVRCDGLL